MILAVALLAVTVAMAQEAIWGRQAVVSLKYTTTTR